MFQVSDTQTMSTDEDKVAEAEAQLEECCRDIEAELEKVVITGLSSCLS